MKYFLAYLLVIFSFTVFAQNNLANKRPKIGITLSGGGAKGLAHIGILKAIDSAGLKIDYITGTSMGAIIGAMYAVGYSADSIETLAKKIDWDFLLSNQLSLRNVTMEEKSEYSKYDVELPWVNNWFRFSTGFLEGQELWLKFAEFFYPVYKIKEFNKFPIPFKCIATDISTGEAVVLDSGELVNALRASMAIPTIFTAVDYKGKKLVDGGVVRNFPVTDVKKMGADFVIGSNVTNELLTSDKVNNALQVLLQIAFFRESEDTRKEVPLCNIYIPFHMEKYSMGSFGDADKIIEMGIERGRQLYPVFKKMADSLNAIYGGEEIKKKPLQQEKPVKIPFVEVHGLERTSEDFFLHSMDFYRGHYYSSENLLHMVRRAAGTRYYSRVNYSLQPINESTAKIIFDVTENALTFAKINLHYDQFNGIAAIFNLTSRDLFTPNSRSLVTINIGDNFRVRAEHLQYLGRLSNFTFTPSIQYDNLSITTYTDYKEAGLYSQNYLKFDGKFDYSTSRNITVGIGTRTEFISYKPSLTSSLEFQGKNNFTTSYVFFKHNTLDREIFPRRGVKIDAEADYVFPQNPNVTAHLTGSNTDSVFSRTPYQRVLFNEEGYIQLAKKSSFIINAQAGINFNYTNNIMNEFVIGGLINTFHNQITFAGLREGTIYSPTVAEMQLGYRYQIFNNSFLTAKANVLFNNFFTTSSYFTAPDFLSGYALTFSYNFALGPIEVSAMYCDQVHRVIGYVNIGVPF
ncbi:MAG TPA: patatin-like phospholipase family protein [Puia sp.]|jgi:NTE family protein|nr:patatin-like phospholipase family protein [Puia sp.]